MVTKWLERWFCLEKSLQLIHNPMRISPKNILIVDDEEEIRRLLRLSLDKYGYRITEASTAIEAKRSAREDPPQLVICDLQLQESDGFELIRELRVRLPGVPTILLTGVLFDPKVVASQIEGLVNAYIPKPTKLNKIVEEIQRLLGDLPAPDAAPAQ